jgi:glycosyltransferase involved in cell wall biosynthesis
LPTGVDRVCLAYLSHFHSKARAVVQFRRYRRILDRKCSGRLFELLLNGSHNFRSELAANLIATAGRTERTSAGQIYLNVGHTGLNSPHIGPWLSERGLRSVFLIHDLIPITHPQYCREGEAARHVQRMETALRSANGLILNSAATARELAQFASARGIVVPPSLNAWLGIDTRPVNSVTVPTECKRPYFVMIGTIEARKNHLLVLQAWREIVTMLGDQAPRLVVIGQRGWEAAEAIAVLDDPGPLEDHVQEMASCDDIQMGKMLAGARAMLMPSFVEGFGLPVVEALREGVPVIASDLPVFREIAGNIPTYLDPHDRAAWAKAIIEYTGNGAERRRQLNAARGYRAPNWADHFDQVEEFLERL